MLQSLVKMMFGRRANQIVLVTKGHLERLSSGWVVSRLDSSYTLCAPCSIKEVNNGFRNFPFAWSLKKWFFSLLKYLSNCLLKYCHLLNNTVGWRNEFYLFNYARNSAKHCWFLKQKKKEKKICIEMLIYFLMTILGHPNKVKRLASLTLFFFFLRLSFPFQFPWQLTVTVDI